MIDNARFGNWSSPQRRRKQILNLLQQSAANPLASSSNPDLPWKIAVACKCIPCFGDWLKKHGYDLRMVNRGKLSDGAERYVLEILDASGRVSGCLNVTCIEAHWFLRVFCQKHSEHSSLGIELLPPQIELLFFKQGHNGTRGPDREPRFLSEFASQGKTEPAVYEAPDSKSGRSKYKYEEHH